MPESSPLVSRASTRAQAAEHVQYSKPKRGARAHSHGPREDADTSVGRHFGAQRGPSGDRPDGPNGTLLNHPGMAARRYAVGAQSGRARATQYLLRVAGATRPETRSEERKLGNVGDRPHRQEARRELTVFENTQD